MTPSSKPPTGCSKLIVPVGLAALLIISALFVASLLILLGNLDRIATDIPAAHISTLDLVSQFRSDLTRLMATWIVITAILGVGSVFLLSHFLSANVSLETQVQERTRELSRTNADLEQSMNALSIRHAQTSLLNEMQDLLQAAQSVEESYSVFSRFAPHYFPGLACGALYLLPPSRNALDAVVWWGDPPPNPVFAPDDCWGVRRGRLYESESGTLCKHVGDLPSGLNTLCFPLTAGGDMIGLFFLAGTAEQLQEKGPIVTFAEQSAMALSNLRLRETLRAQSIRDPLTGLFNRRFMEETLDREIHRAERSEKPLSFLMIDVDHFKDYNTNFGHDAGDTALRSIGLVLQSDVRKDDVPCRYGGEELSLILPETTLETAADRAEQIRVRLSTLQIIHGGRAIPSVTASFGVASFPLCAGDVEELVKASDTALYASKENGRNCVTCAPEKEQA